MVRNTARYYLIFWQLAATIASPFSTSLPPSLPPSEVDIRPTNTKEPSKNKRLTFWTTFRHNPYESYFNWVIQRRAIICCLLILFITQSGSCTLRPARLLLCCVPLHRRQILSDTTSSPLSLTATKTQASKGLAWRVNKSACNSGNRITAGSQYLIGHLVHKW